MVSTARNSNGAAEKGGAPITKNIKIQPGQKVSKEMFVDVKDRAVRLVGVIFEDHVVNVYHVYDGENDCLDIPQIPVMLEGGCEQLRLMNIADVSCSSGRRIRNELWLHDKGRYRIEYVHPQGLQEVPADVYVWCTEGRLIGECSSRHNGYQT